MPGETEETATIREHTDEPAQQPKLAERLKLTPHTIKLIIKPPPTTQLQLARPRATLKIPQHRRHHFIV